MTGLKKQTFSPLFMRPNKIFGSLTTLKSTFQLILWDSSARDSDSLFSARFG